MERDAAISHGASSFLRERLMLVSDAYQTAFCKTCGTFAVNDASTGSYRQCRLCGEKEEFGRCTTPYAYKLLIHLLGAPGINLRPEFVTAREQAEKLFSRGPRDVNTHVDVSGEIEQENEELQEEEIRDEQDDLDDAADLDQEVDYEDVYE